MAVALPVREGTVALGVELGGRCLACQGGHGRPRGRVVVSMYVEEDGYEGARGRAKGGKGHPRLTPEGDRKGPHSSPHHPRPYKDYEDPIGSTVSL